MNAKFSIHRIVRAGAVLSLLCFLGQSSSVGALPAVQRTFDTEILSLHLTGQGVLPLPVPGVGFQDFDVLLDISPEPGARHLGQMTVTPGPGALHPIDSFFDVFFVVKFMDPSSGRLLLPAVHDSARIVGNNMGAPDAGGHFSPAGHYAGQGEIENLDIGGTLFTIKYDIGLDFGGVNPPDPSKDGTLYKFDAVASFTGEINPPFGPFRLTNSAAEPVLIIVQDLPVPGTLALLGCGLVGVILRRKRASA